MSTEKMAFTAVPCSSFNAAVPPVFHKTAATVASMLMSLAPARLAATSFLSSLSISYAFEDR